MVNHFPLKTAQFVLLSASLSLAGCGGGGSSSKLVDDLSTPIDVVGDVIDSVEEPINAIDDLVNDQKQQVEGKIRGLLEPITLELFGQQITLTSDGNFDLAIDPNSTPITTQVIEQGQQVCLVSQGETLEAKPTLKVNCAAKLPLADAIAKVPHENLKLCLSTNLTQTYAHEVKEIKCNQYLIDRVTGLNDFIALEKLDFYLNRLTELDVSANWALQQLKVTDNQISSLDLSELTDLTELRLLTHNLTSIDVSHNPKLTELWLMRGGLEQIDVSKNKHLERLVLFNNPLMQIDVSNNPKLTMLNLVNTQITALDVSQLAALEVLVASNTQIDYLDLSNNTTLTSVLLANTQLADIDLTNNTGLKTLNLSKGRLTQLPTGLANISDKTAEINLTQNPLSDSAKANAAQLQLEYSKLTY